MTSLQIVRKISVLDSARVNIRTLKGYPVPANLNDQKQDMVRLHANESPLSWSCKKASELSINRYPADTGVLRSMISRFFSVNPESVFLCRGSGEGIDLLIRIFCEPGTDEVICFNPGFELYNFYSSLNNVPVKMIERPESQNFSVGISDIINMVTERTKLIFLCNPDNPSGTFMSSESLLELLSKLPDGVFLVLDEAYIDFTETGGMSDFLPQFQNLIILRTLSKAWGLAGARCGAVIAHPDLISLCHAVSAPYSFSTPVLDLGTDLLAGSAEDYQKSAVKEIVRLREVLFDALNCSHLFEKAIKSYGNFLLAKPVCCQSVIGMLADAGMRVRTYPEDGCLKNWIRISVGDQYITDKLCRIFCAENGFRKWL